jgi:hypothetical protein
VPSRSDARFDLFLKLNSEPLRFLFLPITHAVVVFTALFCSPSSFLSAPSATASSTTASTSSSTSSSKVAFSADVLISAPRPSLIPPRRPSLAFATCFAMPSACTPPPHPLPPRHAPTLDAVPPPQLLLHPPGSEVQPGPRQHLLLRGAAPPPPPSPPPSPRCSKSHALRFCTLAPSTTAARPSSTR